MFSTTASAAGAEACGTSNANTVAHHSQAQPPGGMFARRMPNACPARYRYIK